MINLRRRKDPRLWGAKAACHWPRFQLWEVPEATILNTVEDFRWLKDAGLNDQAALQRLKALAGGDPDPPLPVDFTLHTFVARRLNIEDPQYVALGDQMLVEQLVMADKWAQDEIRWAKLEPAYPPIEWLDKRIGVDDIDLDTSSTLGLRHRGHWNLLLARITEGDELWEFNSPLEHWETLAGRKGVALVRGGRPIAHIVTVMN